MEEEEDFKAVSLLSCCLLQFRHTSSGLNIHSRDLAVQVLGLVCYQLGSQIQEIVIARGARYRDGGMMT